MTVALNIILMALVFSAVVGTLAWTIFSGGRTGPTRQSRQSRTVRSASRQPAFARPASPAPRREWQAPPPAVSADR